MFFVVLEYCNGIGTLHTDYLILSSTPIPRTYNTAKNDPHLKKYALENPYFTASISSRYSLPDFHRLS